MGRFGRSRKPKGPKKVAYRLIDTHSAEGKGPYALLSELVEEHHDELIGARIALAWNLSWKPDVDGRVKLGKCKKASDLDRELAAFDFVVLLRQEFWQHPTVTDAQRRALLDHELCHATIKLDKAGEPVEDDRGRKVYRLRKHDIEEFACVVERHGVYTRDLEAFAAALRRSKQKSLPLEPAAAHGPNKAETAQVLAGVAAAAGEVKPGEPHAFEATGKTGLAAHTCTHCGSGATDPVHVPRDTAETSTPGAVPPEASIAAAKERVTGGNGKGPLARARSRRRAAARGHGKAARP